MYGYSIKVRQIGKFDTLGVTMAAGELSVDERIRRKRQGETAQQENYVFMLRIMTF